jgi:hypothetical protein
MALDDKISGILEGIEIEEKDNGQLVLQSQPLEDVQKPYQPSTIPIIGKVVDYVSKKVRKPKEERLQHLIATNLGDYLGEQISNTDSDTRREQLERLQTSFNDYHNVRVNHLAVNHNDIDRPNFFVRNLGYFVGFGLIAAQNVIPGLEDIPRYISYPAIIGASLYAFKKTKNQKVDFPLPPIEEIKADVVKLSEKYKAAKERYPEEMDEHQVTAQQLEKLLPKLPSDVAEQIQQLIDGMEEGATVTLGISKTGQYDADKVPEMKAAVDRYVQQYCPTLDLDNVVVEVSKLRSGKGGGISPFRKNVVKISRISLDSNMKYFYRIYAHELAHVDGIDSEGMADYQAMQVISDMQEEFPDQRHEFEFYDTLLTAAVHTYVIERKKTIRNGRTKMSHLDDVIGYNAKKVVNGVLRREQPSTLSVGVNQKIHDELVEAETPEDVVKRVFDMYENPAIGRQFFFGLQHLLKNDEFMGGYTKDLYEVMKRQEKI